MRDTQPCPNCDTDREFVQIEPNEVGVWTYRCTRCGTVWE